jgi:hypothetical protein
MSFHLSNRTARTAPVAHHPLSVAAPMPGEHEINALLGRSPLAVAEYEEIDCRLRQTPPAAPIQALVLNGETAGQQHTLSADTVIKIASHLSIEDIGRLRIVSRGFRDSIDTSTLGQKWREARHNWWAQKAISHLAKELTDGIAQGQLKAESAEDVAGALSATYNYIPTIEISEREKYIRKSSLVSALAKAMDSATDLAIPFENFHGPATNIRITGGNNYTLYGCTPELRIFSDAFLTVLASQEYAAMHTLYLTLPRYVKPFNQGETTAAAMPRAPLTFSRLANNTLDKLTGLRRLSIQSEHMYLSCPQISTRPHVRTNSYLWNPPDSLLNGAHRLQTLILNTGLMEFLICALQSTQKNVEDTEASTASAHLSTLVLNAGILTAISAVGDVGVIRKQETTGAWHERSSAERKSLCEVAFKGFSQLKIMVITSLSGLIHHTPSNHGNTALNILYWAALAPKIERVEIPRIIAPFNQHNRQTKEREAENLAQVAAAALTAHGTLVHIKIGKFEFTRESPQRGGPFAHVMPSNSNL